jgi:hypothetical protein
LTGDKILIRVVGQPNRYFFVEIIELLLKMAQIERVGAGKGRFGHS